MSKLVLAIVATIAGLGLVVGLIVGAVFLAGSSSHRDAAPSPQHITIQQQNNPAQPPPTHYVPVPGPTQYVPQQPQPVSPDPWSVAVAYTSDINNADNADAWNMLSSSVQAGWNGNYNTYVANFNPLSFDNVSLVSESGDAVTFTFYLHNHDTGQMVLHTCTFTVDNGVITSSVG
jgi:hypothetical protein